MILELLADHVQFAASHAKIWGFLIVFVLMAIESSVIPLPSEAVLIPAGFMAFRGEFTFGSPVPDIVVIVLCGAFGSLLGAYANYFASLFLGRPILHKYGKYFFVPEKYLDRAESLFREYGDITTFICRLLPAIRHLISIPAGLSKMPLGRFSFFTTLGAGIWSAILTGFGCYLGSLSGDMSYRDIIFKGTAMAKHNLIWILLGSAICFAVYFYVHKRVMNGASQGQAQAPSDAVKAQD